MATIRLDLPLRAAKPRRSARAISSWFRKELRINCRVLMRSSFRNHDEIALADLLGFAALNGRSSLIVAILRGIHQFPAHDERAAAVDHIKQFRFLVMNAGI